MKRRIIIFGGAIALYVTLMHVAWSIGTRQAAEKTEAMLDYAVNDMRQTLDGTIDTVLEHLASVAVRHFKKPAAYSMAEVSSVAASYDIDELCLVDRTGLILATNDADSRGVDMNAAAETRPFSALTNGVTKVVSQPFRRHAYSNSRRKYLGVPFPDGNGYVQVGLDEARMDNMIASQLTFLFDAQMEDTVCYLCANMKTGALVSKQLEDGMAQTLDEIGFDAYNRPEANQKLPDVGVDELGKTFEQMLYGRHVYCRSFIFGGHRFLMIEPEEEFYGTRNRIAGAMVLLLALVLGGFAFFLDRIFRDAERLKAFYAAENAARAKDMEIAKTIQTSALPVPLGANPYFRLAASMTPARDVGGDFYDFFLLDQTHLAFVIADVSGKGVTAALYMMTAKTLLKDAVLAARDPAAAFAKVNAELCRNNTANMFLTAWSGVLNLETGSLTFANAGHNPPAVRRADGSIEMLCARSGPVLAFMDGVPYKASTVRLSPGDAIFLYTDGVTEATDDAGTLFGDERLAKTLAVTPSSDPESICGMVHAVVAAFVADAPVADDLTVLAVEYVARPNRCVRTFTPTQAGIAAASDWLDEVVAGHSADGLAVSDASREDGDVSAAPLTTIAPALHIILDEICSNIVKHSGASGFEVDIEFLKDPASVKIVFVDDGKPYDPLTHEDPDTTLPAEDRPIGGLGIMMVRKMSDTMNYMRKYDRNFLTVTKRLKNPQRA